jgi:hypothetical protein
MNFRDRTLAALFSLRHNADSTEARAGFSRILRIGIDRCHKPGTSLVIPVTDNMEVSR